MPEMKECKELVTGFRVISVLCYNVKKELGGGATALKIAAEFGRRAASDPAIALALWNSIDGLSKVGLEWNGATSADKADLANHLMQEVLLGLQSTQ